MQTLSGHASTVTCVAINAKDEQLASVSEKGTLCLHNLNSGTRVAQLRDPDGQVSRLLVVSFPLLPQRQYPPQFEVSFVNRLFTPIS